MIFSDITADDAEHLGKMFPQVLVKLRNIMKVYLKTQFLSQLLLDKRRRRHLRSL
jgi:hypothetical protein